MGLDASIYNNIKNYEMPSIADAQEKGMRLSSLAMQNENAAKQMKRDDENYKMEMVKKVTAEAMPTMQYLAKLPENERSAVYPQSMKELEAKGLPMGNVPRDSNGNYVYDPSHFSRSYEILKNSSGFINEQMAKAKLANEQLEAPLKQAQINKLNSESAKYLAESGKKENGLTEGQKTVDKEFAKDYNDWTSGGAKIARSEINKLNGVVSALKNKDFSTGGLTGVFPDRLTSNKVLSARADVQSTVMNSLKAILGAQFTEKEGERIIKNTWNEADSTENNLARLERLVGDLSNQANDKDSKSKFYEQYGSISGFKSNPGKSYAEQAPEKQQNDVSGFGMNQANANEVIIPKSQRSPQDMEAIFWAKKNKNDPRAQEILKLHGEN